MIYFDSVSIYNRLLQKIQQNPNWNVISHNSVIDSLLRNNAEINAETARYAEYLFKESKWDTAQNMSSILAMANMLGYQPKRKISSRGSIVVSTDPKIQLIGSSVPYSYLSDSTYLSPAIGTVIIGNNCTVSDSLGNKYLVASKRYNSTSEQYTTLEIIQGERKTVEIGIDSIRSLATVSKLDPYLYIPLKIKNCEAANNPLAKSFFKVFINYTIGDPKEYRVVSSLLFSNKQDFDVEVYNDLYSQEVFYLKFNNDSTRGQVLDISKNTSIRSISVQYIETQGAAGNVSTLFNTFVVKGARLNTSVSESSSEITLYGINNMPITGGIDEESIADIKANAPKYYISNYTAGTKEAYEKTIANLELKVTLSVDTQSKPFTLNPTRVQVFGGTSVINGVEQRVTKISFLSANLTDLLETGQLILSKNDNNNTTNTAITAIEDALNFYLIKLKSPQDTLKFEPPTFVTFAVGFNCRVSKDSVIDLGELEQNITNYVDTLWGEASSELDFNRSFYPSQITTEVMTQYPEIVSIETEVEATKRVNWLQAKRVVGKENSTDTSGNIVQDIHVISVPYSFDNVFLGKKAIKGFKDYKSGSDYVARIDFLYKNPKTMPSSTSFNTSWFIKDSSTRYIYKKKSLLEETSETDLFSIIEDGEDESVLRSFVCRKTNDTGLWDASTVLQSRYSIEKLPVLGESIPLGNGTSNVDSILIPYQPELYTDNTFKNLAQDVESQVIKSLTPKIGNSGDLGACNALFVCSTNFNNANTDNSFVSGYLEVDFDSVYSVLNRFSLYDTDLYIKLQNIDVACLKCDYNEDNTTLEKNFSDFMTLLADYLDVYISFRPVDTDLTLGDSSSSAAGRVLQIDSSDKENDLVISNINLTSIKRSRMISVNCEYEE